MGVFALKACFNKDKKISPSPDLFKKLETNILQIFDSSNTEAKIPMSSRGKRE